MNELSAEELMRIYQSENPEKAYAAFTELYRRYSPMIFNFLMKKTKNSADSEDLLQKVFLKIHESYHLYKSEYKVEQWFFVIARSTFLDFYRSKMRRVRREEQVLTVETTSEVDFNLKLDQEDFELLSMKYIDEYSYKEMAQHYKKSEVSLRKTVSRLIGSLRKGEV